ALAVENVGDGHPRGPLDLAVEVEKRHAQTRGEQRAHRRFAGAHEAAEEDEHYWPMERARLRIRGVMKISISDRSSWSRRSLKNQPMMGISARYGTLRYCQPFVRT